MSVDAEKAFDKIQHALMIKAFHKVRIEGIYLNLMRATDNLIHNEKLKAFPRWSRKRQEYPQWSLSFNVVLGSLGTAIRQEIKDIQIGKAVTICKWRDILYRKP